MPQIDLDFGKGYKYRPTVGIFKGDELVIDEKTLFAITYWQDFVKAARQGNGEMTMVKKYRKKTTIKAEQFDGSVEMAKKYDIERGDTGGGYEYYLPTNEGDMAFDEGDWIATGIDGEHWAIADDIFRRTYEEVSNK